MSADDPASLEETLDVMQNQGAMDRIRLSLAEHDAGDSETLRKDQVMALIRGSDHR